MCTWCGECIHKNAHWCTKTPVILYTPFWCVWHALNRCLDAPWCSRHLFWWMPPRTPQHVTPSTTYTHAPGHAMNAGPTRDDFLPLYPKFGWLCVCHQVFQTSFFSFILRRSNPARGHVHKRVSWSHYTFVENKITPVKENRKTAYTYYV